ncbi:MAG: dinitrogenase iron-molybdenum cofactor biosynthesis protein [Cyclobacteriaceae bacterium]|nr:dinitrogenase iron-molybdenum cofactor biosynthesis protein [Cyclobacteriaceae bacterium]
MKIAIPIKNNQVDDHFGHCSYYAIYHTDEAGNILVKEMLKAPEGCGCKSNIASTLKELGVNILLAGNMGKGALDMLRSFGIEVVRGCHGLASDVVADFLAGKLVDSDIVCDHHHDEHCGH